MNTSNYIGPYDDMTDEMMIKFDKNAKLYEKREVFLNNLKKYLPLDIFENEKIDFDELRDVIKKYAAQNDENCG